MSTEDDTFQHLKFSAPLNINNIIFGQQNIFFYKLIGDEKSKFCNGTFKIGS